MATFDEKWSAFCSYVERMTGWPTLKQKRSMVPQMNRAFCTVGISSYEPVGKDQVNLLHQHEDNDLLTQRVRGLVYVQFLVQAFGKGSLQTLKRFTMSFQTAIWKEWSDQNEFGNTDRSEAQDISAVLLDTNFEERAQMTFSFYVPMPEDFDIDFFNKVRVTVEAKDVLFEQDVP